MKTKEYRLIEIKNLAIERNGECLSVEYNDRKTKLSFKCYKCGHQWEALPDNIVNKKSWCSVCSIRNRTKIISNDKRCSKCKTEKCTDEFPKNIKQKDGLHCWCKECLGEANHSNYLKMDKETHRKESREYYASHREQERDRRLQKRLGNKVDIVKYKKEREIKRSRTNDEIKTEKRKKKLAKFNEHYNKDELYKLKHNTRSLIYASIKNGGYIKSSRTATLLGCNFEEFQTHLGPKPSPTHQLDHICPCAQAKSEEELIKLQYYSNFQWMLAFTNNSKNDSWTPEGEELCKSLLDRDWIY